MSTAQFSATALARVAVVLPFPGETAAGLALISATNARAYRAAYPTAPLIEPASSADIMREVRAMRGDTTTVAAARRAWDIVSSLAYNCDGLLSAADLDTVHTLTCLIGQALVDRMTAQTERTLSELRGR